MAVGPTCVLSPTATGALSATAASSSALLVGGGASVVQMNDANALPIVRSCSDLSNSSGKAVMQMLPHGLVTASIDNLIAHVAPGPRTGASTGCVAPSTGTCR